MSLQRRLILAASLVLVAFLGLTGGALDRAFRQTGLEMTRERLLARVYALLAVAETDANGRLTLPADLPDPRLATPASGVYAQVVDDHGGRVWRSRSSVGTEVAFPTPGAPGTPAFTPARTADGRRVFALTFEVRWQTEPGRERGYRIEVAETRAPFDAQLARFRRSLWGWLAGAAALLLAVQGAILRWGLAPLGRLAREVSEVEAGRRDAVSEDWPAEIRPLARSLNGLIGTGRRLLERHRNALGDLAHSLKTPLAVMRGAADRDPALKDAVEDQLERMDRTVEYHLRRVSSAGGGVLTRRVDVASLAARLRDTLLKVHADKALAIDLDVPRGCIFHGDEGDLMEILGNLLDNACKWARTRVRVRARAGPRGGAGPGGLDLEVEDDGPGIAAADAERILERGARADEAVPGHGVGLAVVRELVCEAYAGRLEIERGPLGGARVRAHLAAAG